MSKFQAGYDERRNVAGRPRGRITKFRQMVSELTDDGREIATALRAIITDPLSTKKEVIEASSLLLSYLLGKPEVAVDLDVNANVLAGQIDAQRILAALPTAVVDAVVAQLDADPTLALPAGDGDPDEHG